MKWYRPVKCYRYHTDDETIQPLFTKDVRLHYEVKSTQRSHLKYYWVTTQVLVLVHMPPKHHNLKPFQAFIAYSVELHLKVLRDFIAYLL